jgi:beta-phosphoglucomutase-like phosphatase (HAD superfamily)
LIRYRFIFGLILINKGERIRLAIIKGYIFDIDHTLLNSDKAQIDAALWALKKYGIHRTYAELLKEFDRTTDDMIRVVMGQEGVDKKVSIDQIATLATEKL